MGHSDVDFLDAVLAAVLDHRLQRGNRAFAAVEPEALGAHIFAGEEFLPLLGMDHLGEDRLLALGRELDGFFLALDPALDKTAFLDLVDVHVLEADVPAVGLLKHAHDLAHRGLFVPKHAADPDRPVEVEFGKAMKRGR